MEASHQNMEEDNNVNNNDNAVVEESDMEETQIVAGANDEDDGASIVPSDSDEEDSIFKEQKRRLRLVCPKHPEDIHIENLEQWTFKNHHRAIVHLLVCLAGTEIWCSDKTTIEGRQVRMMKAYKGWVALWKRAQPASRLNEHLLRKSTTDTALLTKEAITRRFKEYVKAPLIKCAAECQKHLDWTKGGIPHSGRQWIDLLNDVKKWWYKHECSRKKLDQQRRTVNKYNLSADVKSGKVPKRKWAAVLPEGWQPPLLDGDFQDPVIPLIARFCPRLCHGLGFRKSPSCFSGKRAPKSSPSAMLTTPTNNSRRSYRKAKTNGTSYMTEDQVSKFGQKTGGYQQPEEMNEEELRVQMMRRMYHTLVAGTPEENTHRTTRTNTRSSRRSRRELELRETTSREKK